MIFYFLINEPRIKIYMSFIRYIINYQFQPGGVGRVDAPHGMLDPHCFIFKYLLKEIKSVKKAK